MKNFRAAQFVKEVKQETSKVTWISRRDVVMSTLMVLVLVAVASVFFLIVDAILFRGVQLLLGFGG